MNDNLHPYLSQRLARVAGDEHPLVVSCIERLVSALTIQHACIDLREEVDVQAALQRSDIVGDGTEVTPLVLANDRLYFHRYFTYEKEVAARLTQKNRPLPTDIDLLRGLDDYFPAQGNDIDWQYVAAVQALTRKLLLVVGGPGTGKTSTVVKILASLLQGGNDLRVLLAAPTGKAAMRLSESIRQFLPQLDEPVASRIPQSVQTLHRLLGYQPSRNLYRHHEGNPLDADVLIVDEVSMIDLVMMHRLLAAIPDSTRVIFLGDADQLPSVETGNVLGDICAELPGFDLEFVQFMLNLRDINLPVNDNNHSLKNAVCRLQESYRFRSDEGIGRQARLIRGGSDDMTSDEQITFVTLNDPLKSQLYQQLEPYFTVAQQPNPDIREVFRLFDDSRILCPMREGPFGLNDVNRDIEARLESAGKKPPQLNLYAGKPIMILRNDYNLGLFNGDVGICVDTETGLKIAFQDTNGEPRYFLATRLPAHDTCYAMTVHKSQGSEYRDVTLLLPPPVNASAANLHTRELLYTAVTRAKAHVTIATDKATWSDAVARTSGRASGLSDFFTR